MVTEQNETLKISVCNLQEMAKSGKYVTIDSIATKLRAIEYDGDAVQRTHNQQTKQNISTYTCKCI